MTSAVVILMVNSLIALMNETFVRMQSTIAQQQLLLIAELINEQEKRVPLFRLLTGLCNKRETASTSWLHVIRLSSSHIDPRASSDGSVRHVKTEGACRAIDRRALATSSPEVAESREVATARAACVRYKD